MKGFLLLVAAVLALVAVSHARPMLFVADQTDAPLGISNGWAGIAYAFSTFKKGQTSYRLRIFGGTSINETITDAWLQFKNGTIIDHLAFSPNNRVFLADARLNYTIWDALLNEEVYATVASSSHKNGSITGYFRCRPYQGFAITSSEQVVGTNPNETSTIGFGWGEINVGSIFSLPQDILAQDAAITASSLFNGRVVLEPKFGTTAITFNGPANASSTASALATATLYGADNDGKFTGVTVTDDFYSISTGETYFQVTGTGGALLRGNVYPLLTPTRRSIPYSVDTVNGVTVVPSAGFRTLRYANQEGNHRNPHSYISLQSVANPTNFTYLGIVYMKAATNRRNFDIVRAYTVEMNARITGTGTWLFEFFNSFSGEFLPVGTLTTADEWTPAYIDNWSFDVNEYADSRGELIMRISVNSAVQSTLDLDLFGVRSWTPSSFTNQIIKSSVQDLDALEAVFANGTVVNESS